LNHQFFETFLSFKKLAQPVEKTFSTGWAAGGSLPLFFSKAKKCIYIFPHRAIIGK